MEALRAEGLEPIMWPPSSPDLNPIESVWNTMKNCIEVRHPEVVSGWQLSRRLLNTAIVETWETINSEKLGRLIKSMPRRCRAIIEAEGGATKY